MNQEDQNLLRNHLKKPTISQLKDQVGRIQRVLKKHECYDGPVDGILTPSIIDSISAFQKKKGINDDGAIGYEVLAYVIESDINDIFFLETKKITKTGE